MVIWDLINGSYWFQAAIGGWHCLAVDDQGRAYAWGIVTRLLLFNLCLVSCLCGEYNTGI